MLAIGSGQLLLEDSGLILVIIVSKIQVLLWQP
jgi:hypothetical protein